jgi:hypothetical protein
MHELAMQFLDDAGVVQDNFGDERPGLEIPTALTLEEIPLGAHHGAAPQHRRQIRHMVLLVIDHPERPQATVQIPARIVMHENLI